jgi:hypothetical protein
VPIVFGEIHGFPLGSVGLAFVPIIVGMLSTFVTVLPWQAKHYARVDEECRAQGLASAPPEARLPSVKVGAVLLPIGFFSEAFRRSCSTTDGKGGKVRRLTYPT